MLATHLLPTQADSSALSRVIGSRRLTLVRIVWLTVAALAGFTGIPQSYQKALLTSPATSVFGRQSGQCDLCPLAPAWT